MSKLDDYKFPPLLILIEPFGIEIPDGTCSCGKSRILIEPFGIEIAERDAAEKSEQILIEPFGIEIALACGEKGYVI